MLCAVYTSPQEVPRHSILWSQPLTEKEQLDMATKKKAAKKAAKKGGTKKAAKKSAKKR